MSKNSILFIFLLAILAVGIGYSKYVLLPKYQAQLNREQVVLAASPSPSPMSAQLSAEAVNNQVLAYLSPRRRIAQLIAVSLPTPISSTSAVLNNLLVEQLGTISLGNQNVSTSSAQQALTKINLAVKKTSELPILVHLVKTGTGSELCSVDQQCVNILDKPTIANILSQPLEINLGGTGTTTSDSTKNSVSAPMLVASSNLDNSMVSTASASVKLLANQVISQLQADHLIITLSPKIKVSQITELITELQFRYQSDLQIKKLVDKKVLQVISLKEEYK